MTIQLKKLLVLSIATFFSSLIFAQEVSIKINKKYLNLPVSQQVERKKMSLEFDGKKITPFNIRLAQDQLDYWVFYDLSNYKGKTLKISYEGNAAGLKKIYQADTFPGQSNLYREKNRPQFHFSTQRGWINDPNGLVFYNGQYHLYYQLNPYEVEWNNMHWGHAVSTDLIHWKQLPIALYPDELGMMFSGSAVIDYNNTSGFGKNGVPPMVVMYTTDCQDGEIQCVAYSLDNGNTLVKYDKNPVLNTRMNRDSWDNRDPKVFWYKPGNHWVMALHEKDGHSIYTSNNLKDWTYQSHTTGFWECPELFELPVDGDKKNTRWVMYGASGTYMIGSFDGKTFKPETGKHYNTTGYIYAPQTYNNIPENDGRRIQIGWASITHPGMPFRGMMLLPVELNLKTTKDGIRLVSFPVKETEQLFTPVLKSNALSMQKANEMLQTLDTASTLRIRTTIRLSHSTSAGLKLYGQNILDYDMNNNKVNGVFYSPQDMTSMELTADFYIDRTSVEVFIDGGHYSYILDRKADNTKTPLQFWGSQNIEVKNLEVYAVKSIWRN